MSHDNYTQPQIPLPFTCMSLSTNSSLIPAPFPRCILSKPGADLGSWHRRCLVRGFAPPLSPPLSTYIPVPNTPCHCPITSQTTASHCIAAMHLPGLPPCLIHPQLALAHYAFSRCPRKCQFSTSSANYSWHMLPATPTTLSAASPSLARSVSRRVISSPTAPSESTTSAPASSLEVQVRKGCHASLS